ncbi:carboxymuconolactone decarboxylase family protein [Couchioplanes caeruleus]|uniref:Alkylhydroperoxidase n=2 Tax=Couchioplanes caeruleus TaxID=56438 RepID=A0A1K0GR79_9ACTN|nr:carboxymuconolactone decarboxylase family protein [Couchioplanes caeruleus]OJF13692.1 alkylhydroperoxidase [Couchioplanes caeruleus subsp. caeruleus]ROP29646.1 AhpD family alkylhydroperoxidase [Couchioplanes caeruleus]
MSRLTIDQVAPGAYRAVLGMEQYCRQTVDPTLLELIKLRASMVNGCSFCTDMHSREALEQGESSRRLFAVAAWHDAPFFSERERAALALTDAVTRLGEHGVPDEVWEPAAKAFTEEELGNLLMAIATINVWNRLSIAVRNEPPAL